MSKTADALDNLASSLVNLIPTWLSMLTSTRVLATIGTVAAIYFEYQATGGLSTTQALVMAALTAITGVTFTVAKSVSPSKPTSASASPIPVIDIAGSGVAAAAASAPALAVPQVKDRIKVARATFGVWEGAKLLLLGTFKDAFENALKRMLSLNPSMATIDAVRQVIMDVVGVQLDTKTCTIVSQMPGFLGAISAHADIQIISDLLTAIDKTPELAYMKTTFTARAVWYAVKGIIDDAALRVRAGDGNDASKLALQEFGLTAWQAGKSQWNGADLEVWYSTTPNVPNTFGFRPFDPWALAGVDSGTLLDI